MFEISYTCNSHALCVSPMPGDLKHFYLMHQGQFLMPDSQIRKNWSNSIQFNFPQKRCLILSLCPNCNCKLKLSSAYNPFELEVFKGCRNIDLWRYFQQCLEVIGNLHKWLEYFWKSQLDDKMKISQIRTQNKLAGIIIT